MQQKEVAANTTKKEDDRKPVELVSKVKYERLVRSHERSQQENKDLKDVIKEMRFRDTNVKGFILHYLKPKHRPRISEDGESELWSEDGKYYSSLYPDTLEPANVKRYRYENGKKIQMKHVEYPYRKPLEADRKYKLKRLEEKIAGREYPIDFTDSQEDKVFDYIARRMT